MALTRDDVDALRKGALLDVVADTYAVTYKVVRVRGLKHANLRYRKIWVQPINGTRQIAYDADQLVGRDWKVL